MTGTFDPSGGGVMLSQAAPSSVATVETAFQTNLTARAKLFPECLGTEV